MIWRLWHRRQLVCCCRHSWRHWLLLILIKASSLESIALIEIVLSTEVLNVRTVPSGRIVVFIRHQKASLTSDVLTFRCWHVEVLNDGPAIFVEHMFLTEFTKFCSTVIKHHISSLIEWILLLILTTLAFSLAIYVPIRCLLGTYRLLMIVIKNNRTRTRH